MVSLQVTGRALVYTLLDILCEMRPCVTGQNEEFYEFMTKHIVWLSSLMNASYNSDSLLYLPIHKHMVRTLRHYLKYPESYYGMGGFDIYMGDYINMKTSCWRFAGIDDKEEYYRIDMNHFFTKYVAKLEHVLANTDYTTLKEQNREFYHELNKYILKPERIEKMAHDYGINSIEYLDAIGV